MVAWNQIGNQIRKQIGEQIMEQKNRWISVEDQLPEDYQEVLVFCQATDETTSFKEVVMYFPVAPPPGWDEFLKKRYQGGFCEAEDPDLITHWCPLSPDPEKVNED